MMGDVVSKFVKKTQNVWIILFILQFFFRVTLGQLDHKVSLEFLELRLAFSVSFCVFLAVTHHI